MSDFDAKVQEFVGNLTSAMGLSVEAAIERTPDGLRLNLQGDDASVLLARRGEPLQALQHLVDSAFREAPGDPGRVLVDCLGFRRDKDLELRQMAKFLAEKVKTTGTEQQIGPLNAYERRIVHMAVAEDPALSSESIGDAAQKTVTISKRR